MTSNAWANGSDLVAMFGRGACRLEAVARGIDSINVFPVPDGDTGTNMLHTLKQALARVSAVIDGDSVPVKAGRAAAILAHGAMEGARGNSGLILSQLFRGLAFALDGRARANGKDLVAGFTRAAACARTAISTPVEGTMLTVLDDVAAAMEAPGNKRETHPSAVLSIAADAARKSVARTPSLLPVLREFGVVDAGALGLCLILDGLAGREETEELMSLVSDTPVLPLSHPDSYGCCTECLIDGEALDAEQIRHELSALGESVMVAGDECLVRVHLHTSDPEAVAACLRTLGTVRGFTVQDMGQQIRGRTDSPDSAICPIAVTHQLGELLTQLGALVVRDLREARNAMESLLDREVIVVGDVSAEEEHRLLSHAPTKVAVVHTTRVPQQVSALVAFRHDEDLYANARRMAEASEKVRTVEIRREEDSRSAVFLDGEFIGAANDPERLLETAMARAAVSKPEVVTVYHAPGSAAPDWILHRLGVLVPGVTPEVVPAQDLVAEIIVSVE